MLRLATASYALRQPGWSPRAVPIAHGGFRCARGTPKVTGDSAAAVVEEWLVRVDGRARQSVDAEGCSMWVACYAFGMSFVLCPVVRRASEQTFWCAYMSLSMRVCGCTSPPHPPLQRSSLHQPSTYFTTTLHQPRGLHWSVLPLHQPRTCAAHAPCSSPPPLVPACMAPLLAPLLSSSFGVGDMLRLWWRSGGRHALKQKKRKEEVPLTGSNPPPPLQTPSPLPMQVKV